ncbi:hypothetical protein AMAG_16253 [Allomyces macrogynus ATCC 38327]|uniref:Uncharacterized protein n=1 Tax=Allomyces macrogynus (strain ATCC 38327) TaxID=578462 RepID=A0A0L0TAF8_ALLM3|nr:hypothetical protein AMAG_16253 [Allomyces macrogynus ATCC 38327]|eukprot:KNE71701.1 hypothetical protein AMAG_16253 [Allomyces macrogynus ATCC 38327]
MASWPAPALPNVAETLFAVLPLSAAAFSTSSGTSTGSVAPTTTVTSTTLGDLAVRVVLRAPPTSAALVVVHAGEMRLDLPLPPAATEIALLAGGKTCALRTNGQLRVKLLFANASEAHRLRAVLSAALAQGTGATVQPVGLVGPVAGLFPLTPSAGHGLQGGHGSQVATVLPSSRVPAATQSARIPATAQPARVPEATHPAPTVTFAAWSRPNGLAASLAVAPSNVSLAPLAVPALPVTSRVPAPVLTQPAPIVTPLAPTPPQLAPALITAAPAPVLDPVHAAPPSPPGHAPEVVPHAADQVDMALLGSLSERRASGPAPAIVC